VRLRARLLCMLPGPRVELSSGAGTPRVPAAAGLVLMSWAYVVCGCAGTKLYFAPCQGKLT